MEDEMLTNIQISNAEIAKMTANPDFINILNCKDDDLEIEESLDEF